MRPETELFPGKCVTECKDGGRCFLLVVREVTAAFRAGVEACVEAASAARAVFILFLCHEIHLLSVFICLIALSNTSKRPDRGYGSGSSP